MALRTETTAQQFFSNTPTVDAPESDALEAQLLDGIGETAVAAPEAPQEETYIIKKGDKLGQLAVQFGIPLKKLAEDNGITDVHTIQIGQEIRYTKPGPPDTDISAAPATDGFNIGDLTIEGETTTAVDAATGTSVPILPNEATEDKRQQQLATSDGGTSTNTQTISELDFVAKPVAEASIDGKPVVENDSLLPVTEVQPVTNIKMQRETIAATLPEESKTVFKDIVDKIDGLGIEPEGEDFYKKIADDINTTIEAYNTKINAIAEEKQTVKVEGWNKFLAVLGAAMGAYGSAMTGTPNYALKIVEGAIDRDAQMFLKSKEIRTKSLENQRAELLMRRGELLQMAQNRISQLMQSETFKLSKAESKANIIALEKGIAQKELKNKQDYQLVMSGQLVSLITSEQSLKASLNKEQSGRLVSHMTFKDGEGNDFIAPAYVAPTEKEAIKDRDKQEATENILLIMEELGPLYEDAARFAPGAFSETRIKINALNAKLESAVKTALGMGANYTPYEVTLVSAQIPSANDWTEMVGTAQKKMNALRNSMVIDMKAARQGVVTNYNTASQTQTIPGLKKGVSTVSD